MKPYFMVVRGDGTFLEIAEFQNIDNEAQEYLFFVSTPHMIAATKFYEREKAEIAMEKARKRYIDVYGIVEMS